jgi:hypothetical protein
VIIGSAQFFQPSVKAVLGQQPVQLLIKRVARRPRQLRRRHPQFLFFRLPLAQCHTHHPDPDGGEPAPEAWREALARTLPGYMVPGVFHRLDELPRLPNGKVDRNRLAQIAATEGVLEGAGDGSGGAEHVPPETDTERAVAAIWSEVLGRDGIGVRDDFFRIGGHSLLATRIMARIRRRLGADLPLRALFQHPTIRSLATAVDEGGEGAGDEQGAKPPAPTIRKVDRRRRHRSDVG